MADVYDRRVSAEEAREGYVLVEKAKLAFFPQRGRPFVIVRDGEEREGAVESYACTCRGPEKPHEHFILRLAGLAPGEHVRLRRAGEGRYELEISGPG